MKTNIFLTSILALTGISVSLDVYLKEERPESGIYYHETPVARFLKPQSAVEQHSGILGLDNIYVINLNERPDKWQRMKGNLESRGMHATRFAAINGWKIPIEVQEILGGPYGARLNGGQLGCLLSHLSVIQDASNRKFDLVWIMEDDVDFGLKNSEREVMKLVEKVSAMDPSWDVIYTDTDTKDSQGQYWYANFSDYRPDRQHPPLNYYLERVIIDSDFSKIRQRFGMYSYLLSKKGMEKILNYFKHVYLWTAIDMDIHYIPGIRQYAPNMDIISVDYSNGINDTKKEVTLP